MDWKAFKACLFESARAKLDALLSEGIEPLYAAVFFASYREQEAIISLPSLATNNLAMLDQDHPKHQQRADEGFWSLKWNPSNWHWSWDPDDYGGENLASYEAMLETFANRGTVAQWDKAEEQFITTVAQVAVALYKHFAKDPRVNKDFVVFFHDESRGPELARKCMSPRLFLHHFPEQDATQQERLRVAALPLSEQAAYYVQRLGCYENIDGEEAEKWLIACGAPAIPALLGSLHKKNDAWKVAMILGLIGEKNAEVITALRDLLLTAKDISTSRWCASALGYLEDIDWLLAQCHTPKALDLAVEGCCANFSAFRNRSAKTLCLNYTLLERLFGLYPQSHALAEETLRPGSSYCDIGAADIPEALRGLASPHAVIRRHATCVLNNRSLGESLNSATIAHILAALAPLAGQDSDETVRYLAGLTLKSMKKWRITR
ncbi:hypothetical protein Z042_02795 [Chania multitudinisentens RB-25]|uniref:DUF4303 domain-containing protein n=2 Tax=Chania TaxID=1745211 RepID=W0LJL4_9GAMM|nr:hypothetical protein Z042_02795 [Chania multitudinisentens RB-25]